MESCPVTPPRARGTSASGQRVLTPQPLNSPAPPRSPREENAVGSTPPTSCGKRRREPSFGGNSSSEGVGDPKARAPSGVPTAVKNGLAFYSGAVRVPKFTGREQQHIEDQLTFQRAYDSVNILSNGKPVVNGVDLALAPVLAGVIDTMTYLVGKRPDCVHLTTRQSGQLHTSHSDKMRFDLRGAVHFGADVLLGGQVNPARSTGDFILSGDGLSQPLLLRMRSGDAYLANSNVLHAPLLHGISPPDQPSLSVICTWSPGRGGYNPWRGPSQPLAKSFPLLCGVKAVDGEEAFNVTTTERVPPKRIKSRIRQPGDYTDGVSLFRAPPEDQASAYHWLGTTHGATGANSCSHEGCKCTSAELDKCVCEDHGHVKNASVRGTVGGKGTQGRNIPSSGGARGGGAAVKKETVDISNERTLIGRYRRAHVITTGEKKGQVKIGGMSRFYHYGDVRHPGYGDVRHPGSQKRILGLHQFDTNGSDKTLSYPVDNKGKMVTGVWDDDPSKGLYNAHLVGYARDYVMKRTASAADSAES